MKKTLIAVSFALVAILVISLKFTVFSTLEGQESATKNNTNPLEESATELEQILQTAGSQEQLSDEFDKNLEEEINLALLSLENEDAWLKEFESDLGDNSQITIEVEDAPGAAAATIQEIDQSLLQSLKDEWELNEE